MNEVRWANPQKSAVWVETDTNRAYFGVNPANPDWIEVVRRVSAGELEIQPYEPPKPLDE